ncbi:hypothetical protein AB0C12_14830 [Actinoplanes sp. NPDC048967]|uniref:hypothetical protein n=1 Tax=Actinoplanes sp. NPDC048967 TaxID=3155269 RepID=UPI0033DC003F
MIVVSLLLILVAVTLLVLGLVGGSSSLLISSIVASLLAAVALVIGARQASAARRAATAPAGDAARAAPPPEAAPDAAYVAGQEDAEEHLTGPDATQRVQPDADLYDYDDAAAGRPSSGQTAGPAPTEQAPADYEHAASFIGGARAEDPSSGEFDEPDPDDPDDEPLPQSVRPADAVRVASLDAEVLVVDGRPRYHLADCSHLVGRMTEGLPVAEAVELGFSPCGLCRPVDRLVAAAARR